MVGPIKIVVQLVVGFAASYACQAHHAIKREPQLVVVNRGRELQVLRGKQGVGMRWQAAMREQAGHAHETARDRSQS